MNTPLALLLTDVVDSTQRNDRLGDPAMAALWAAHDRAARDLMRQWGGREIGRSDGFLVLFETADSAVAFALAYHRSLAALDPPLQARAGIHVGPVDLRRNSDEDTARGATPFEVDGIALPTAARVMALALGRQTLLSQAALESLGNTDLQRRDHGHWRLKGLDEPLRIHEIGEPGIAPFVAPPDGAKGYRVLSEGEGWRPLREVPHNLPDESDEFVGRAGELQALAARFDRGARLVTLLGIGGIGKTRLARRFARGWRGEFPGGVWFCDLSAARSADGLAHAMAQALDVPLGKADPMRQLGAAIAGRGRCLLIADNVEQVAEHARVALQAWLDAAPQSVWLVTSRELLGLPGEHALPLEPLAAAEAQSLFRERMAAAPAGRSNDDGDPGAIAALVELIDRLPLAIELAAARARVIPPRDQLQRMGERFKLLAARSGRHDRQATMRAALDWGYELLGPAERAALAQLTVFEGGFTVAAAEAVLALPDDPWVPDILQALLEKSWLRRTGSSDRLTMLATVHHYGRELLERLQAIGDPRATRVPRRHWQHFAGLDEAQATAERCVEIENLVQACRGATAAGDAASALACLQSAWAALRLTGPLGAALALAEACRQMPALGADQRAAADWVAGSALHLLGHSERARALLASALQSVGDPLLQARLACTLGELESTTGDPAQAEPLLQQALQTAQAMRDAPLQCRALNALGALASDEARWSEAERCYMAGLALARAGMQARWEGVLLGNLGTLHHYQGRAEPAAEHYAAAITLAQRVGDRRGEGDRRCNLGLLHLEAGRFDAAHAELQLAQGIAGATGHARLQGVALCNLGLACEGQSRSDEAHAAFAEAMALAARMGDSRAEAQYGVYLGRHQVRRGQLSTASATLRRGQVLLEGSADAALLGLLCCAQAELAASEGDLERGRSLLDAADRHLWESGAGAASELGRELSRLRTLMAGVLSPG